MQLIQVREEKPSKICEGLIAVRFMRIDPHTSSRDGIPGFRVTLEDGGCLYFMSERAVLKILTQMETRYKVLPKSKGYYLENPQELLELAVENGTPIIIKREIRETFGASPTLLWNHQIAELEA